MKDEHHYVFCIIFIIATILLKQTIFQPRYHQVYKCLEKKRIKEINDLLWNSPKFGAVIHKIGDYCTLSYPIRIAIMHFCGPGTSLC